MKLSDKTASVGGMGSSQWAWLEGLSEAIWADI